MPDRRKLTDRIVKTLKPPAMGRHSVYDAENPGLALVITAAGRKTWRYVYTVGGRGGQRDQMTLGTYPATSLASARELYRGHRAKVQQGVNPAHEKKAEQQVLTLAQLAEKYFASARMKNRSDGHRRNIRQSIEREIVPTLGKHKARNITRQQLRPLILAVRDRGAPTAANRLLAYVKAMYNWAIENDHVEDNPAVKIKTDVEERPRERVLSESEIRRFWHGLTDTGMSEVTKLALRLSLATAQRKGETLKARWEHIDLTERVWSIPAADTKNKRGVHRVPLSDLAIELLTQAKTFSDGSDWVFPSPARPGRHMVETSVSRALNRALAVLGIEDATPHDLRRTAATMLASSGAERDYIKRILNHVDSSVTGIYDRYSYDEEKRRYLDRWGRRLQTIVDGASSNVVAIR